MTAAVVALRVRVFCKRQSTPAISGLSASLSIRTNYTVPALLVRCKTYSDENGELSLPEHGSGILAASQSQDFYMAQVKCQEVESGGGSNSSC
jgi:hypothetical protein